MALYSLRPLPFSKGLFDYYIYSLLAIRFAGRFNWAFSPKRSREPSSNGRHDYHFVIFILGRQYANAVRASSSAERGLLAICRDDIAARFSLSSLDDINIGYRAAYTPSRRYFRILPVMGFRHGRHNRLVYSGFLRMNIDMRFRRFLFDALNSPPDFL